MFNSAYPSHGRDFHPAGTMREAVPYLKLVEGDTYADWEAAYLDNVGRLYRLMYSRVGNRPDAEDLTAEVFKSALGPLRLSTLQHRALRMAANLGAPEL